MEKRYNKKIYDVYYIFKNNIKKLTTISYNNYEKLYYKYDNNGYRITKLGKYILILPFRDKQCEQF